ncbi:MULTISPECIES: DUF2939 domain-containing protein [unclassified Janthinobacterium]|uniref:DUF2939 domain-containing protein n=1 Tax=unclassified Janthinobacterium TaxID=2610881 RepID=UPI00161DDB02|nr:MULTISPECIES: DUF2939 domain-containing protein [unclassified Janthinobacterium]MBB5606199.1 putative membrane protein [Janthinobacterium sp. S3T4]MBB5611929.1 putative membrane protein [Janthinobacterium sp. S3M3]
MKKIALATAVAAVALAASVYASPYYALHQMKNAIAERNVDALASHVDFPALRISIKSQLETTLADSIQAATASDNPFAAMGQAMVTTMLGKMVDAMVSPEGVAAMVSKSAVGAEADKSTPDTGAQQKKDYSVAYAGWDKFIVRAKADGDEKGGLVLLRHGLWNWKLSAIELTPAVAGHE